MTPAEAAERAAFAEIGALGERELAAVKAWVASGCEGPEPRPDPEARRVLSERQMAAIRYSRRSRNADTRLRP